MSKVYEVITSRIVKLLEIGTVPWRRPWSGESGHPKNLISRKGYRGINVFMLATAGYENPYWLTFKQAKSLGGSVRKGEHGFPVVFWNWHERADEQGKINRFPIIRYYTAFNVAQCELPADKMPAMPSATRHDWNPIAECDRVVGDMPKRPGIQLGTTGAYYRPATDTVSMPSRDRFEIPAEYYSTLFHELTHATGHETRLNRKGITDVAPFGSHTYSQEELVAEMGAAFLCGHCGIETATLDNSAAYLAGWLRKLRAEPRLVVTAAAQAQKASDFILGREAQHTEGGE